MIIFKGHLNSKNKKIQLTHQTRNIPLWLALPSRQQDEGLPVYWVAASLALVGLDGSKVVLDSCWHHGTLLLILLWRQGKCKHNRVPSGRTGLGKYGWLVLTEQIKLLVKVALSYQVYYRKKNVLVHWVYEIYCKNTVQCTFFLSFVQCWSVSYTVNPLFQWGSGTADPREIKKSA